MGMKTVCTVHTPCFLYYYFLSMWNKSNIALSLVPFSGKRMQRYAFFPNLPNFLPTIFKNKRVFHVILTHVKEKGRQERAFYSKKHFWAANFGKIRFFLKKTAILARKYWAGESKLSGPLRPIRSLGLLCNLIIYMTFVEEAMPCFCKTMYGNC
jgi:hypothetical protein